MLRIKKKPDGDPDPIVFAIIPYKKTIDALGLINNKPIT